MTIETIIRPFQSPGHSPQPFDMPGQVGVPLVKVQVGMKGGGKTFTFSYSATQTSYMIRVHREKPNDFLSQV
jgi:hypothetical protein